MNKHEVKETRNRKKELRAELERLIVEYETHPDEGGGRGFMSTLVLLRLIDPLKEYLEL